MPHLSLFKMKKVVTYGRKTSSNINFNFAILFFKDLFLSLLHEALLCPFSYLLIYF